MDMERFRKVYAKHAGCNINVSRQLINGFVDAVAECLMNGERVHITGFGSFYTEEIPPHEKFDLKTRTYTITPPYVVMRFKPSRKFKYKYIRGLESEAMDRAIEERYAFDVDEAIESEYGEEVDT